LEELESTALNGSWKGQLMTSRDFIISRMKDDNIFMLVHKVQGQKCIDLKDGDIQEVFNSYTAELTEGL